MSIEINKDWFSQHLLSANYTLSAVLLTLELNYSISFSENCYPPLLIRIAYQNPSHHFLCINNPPQKPPPPISPTHIPTTTQTCFLSLFPYLLSNSGLKNLRIFFNSSLRSHQLLCPIDLTHERYLEFILFFPVLLLLPQFRFSLLVT